jgi:hypothetical protein
MTVTATSLADAAVTAYELMRALMSLTGLISAARRQQGEPRSASADVGPARWPSDSWLPQCPRFKRSYSSSLLTPVAALERRSCRRRGTFRQRAAFGGP